MANEIRETVSVSVSRTDGFQYSNSFSNNQDQTGTGGVDARRITVTTSESNVTFVNITTEGVILVTNLDATNFLEYGPDVSGTMKLFGKILPGETHKIRLGTSVSVTLRWVANTASVDVWLEAHEN